MGFAASCILGRMEWDVSLHKESCPKILAGSVLIYIDY